MKDFCMAAVLETAHILYDEVDSKDAKVATKKWKVDYSGDNTDAHGHPIADQIDFEYVPEDGWQINTSNPFAISYQKKIKVSLNPPLVTADLLRILGNLDPGGHLDATLSINLTSIDETKSLAVRKLFLSARELCCCPPSPPKAGPAPTGKPAVWISYETDLTHHAWQFKQGFMSKHAFGQSRVMAKTIRLEMIKSFSSSRRQESGSLSYADSDSFLTLLANALKSSRLKEKLATPLSDASALDDTIRGQLYRALGHITVGDLLTTDGILIARLTSLEQTEVSKLKKQLIRWIRESSSRRGQ
jgi:hypothetical protein